MINGSTDINNPNPSTKSQLYREEQKPCKLVFFTPPQPLENQHNTKMTYGDTMDLRGRENSIVSQWATEDDRFNATIDPYFNTPQQNLRLNQVFKILRHNEYVFVDQKSICRVFLI